MRVPIPLVILLALTLVGGIWWKNTRHLDFLKEPSALEMEQIRLGVDQRLAALEQTRALQIPEAPPPPPDLPPAALPEKTAVDLGDLKSPAILQSYVKLSSQGAAKLTELAMALEEGGEPTRALLAWERVLDLGQPSQPQLVQAMSAIKRLRATLPEWNAKPESATTVRLHVAVGKNLVKALATNLKPMAQEIEFASSKIVKIETHFSTIKTTQAASALQVSMAGVVKKSRASETIRAVSTPEALRDDILKIIYQIIAKQLRETTTYRQIPSLNQAESPQEALKFQITRLCWQEFATGMNLPPQIR